MIKLSWYSSTKPSPVSDAYLRMNLIYACEDEDDTVSPNTTFDSFRISQLASNHLENHGIIGIQWLHCSCIQSPLPPWQVIPWMTHSCWFVTIVCLKMWYIHVYLACSIPLDCSLIAKMMINHQILGYPIFRSKKTWHSHLGRVRGQPLASVGIDDDWPASNGTLSFESWHDRPHCHSLSWVFNLATNVYKCHELKTWMATHSSLQGLRFFIDFLGVLVNLPLQPTETNRNPIFQGSTAAPLERSGSLGPALRRTSWLSLHLDPCGADPVSVTPCVRARARMLFL